MRRGKKTSINHASSKKESLNAPPPPHPSLSPRASSSANPAVAAPETRQPPALVLEDSPQSDETSQTTPQFQTTSSVPSSHSSESNHDKDVEVNNTGDAVNVGTPPPKGDSGEDNDDKRSQDSSEGIDEFKKESVGDDQPKNNGERVQPNPYGIMRLQSDLGRMTRSLYGDERAAVTSMQEHLMKRIRQKEVQKEVAMIHREAIARMRNRMQDDFQFTHRNDVGDIAGTPPAPGLAGHDAAERLRTLSGSFLVTEEWNWLRYHETHICRRYLTAALLVQAILPAAFLVRMTLCWLYPHEEPIMRRASISEFRRREVARRREQRYLILDVVAWIAGVVAITIYISEADSISEAGGSGGLHHNETFFFSWDLLPLAIVWAINTVNHAHMLSLSLNNLRLPLVTSLHSSLLPAYKSFKEGKDKTFRKEDIQSEVTAAMAGTRLTTFEVLVSYTPPKPAQPRRPYGGASSYLKRFRSILDRHGGRRGAQPPIEPTGSTGNFSTASSRTLGPGNLGMGFVDMGAAKDKGKNRSANGEMEGGTLGGYVFPATDIAREILARSRHRHRNKAFHLATWLCALSIALTPQICRIKAKSAAISHASGRQAIAGVCLFFATFYHTLIIMRVVHTALNTYMERKHVNKYLGGILIDVQADWFQLPHVELQDPRTCAFNAMGWLQMRFVLLRICDSQIRRLATFMSSIFLLNSLLLVAVVVGALVVKEFSAAMATMLVAALVLTLYIIQIIERSGQSNTDQLVHFKRLAKAEFVLRQHQMVMPATDKEREQYDLACEVLNSMCVYLELNDRLCVVFGLKVDSNMTTRVLLFIVTAICGVTLEILLDV